MSTTSSVSIECFAQGAFHNIYVVWGVDDNPIRVVTGPTPPPQDVSARHEEAKAAAQYAVEQAWNLVFVDETGYRNEE